VQNVGGVVKGTSSVFKRILLL